MFLRIIFEAQCNNFLPQIHFTGISLLEEPMTVFRVLGGIIYFLMTILRKSNIEYRTWRDTHRRSVTLKESVM